MRVCGLLFFGGFFLVFFFFFFFLCVCFFCFFSLVSCVVLCVCVCVCVCVVVVVFKFSDTLCFSNLNCPRSHKPFRLNNQIRFFLTFWLSQFRNFAHITLSYYYPIIDFLRPWTHSTVSKRFQIIPTTSFIYPH